MIRSVLNRTSSCSKGFQNPSVMVSVVCSVHCMRLQVLRQPLRAALAQGLLLSGQRW